MTSKLHALREGIWYYYLKHLVKPGRALFSITLFIPVTTSPYPKQKGDWKYKETILGEMYHQENTVPEKPQTMIEVNSNIYSNKGLIIKTSNMPLLEGDMVENDLAYTLDYNSKQFIDVMARDIVLIDLVLRLHDDLEIQTHILTPTWSWRVN